jgi:hypothetical protein
VTIPSPNSSSPQTVQARFWYDGQYVNNAREDAAEVALRVLTGSSPTGSAASSSSGAQWPRSGSGGAPNGGSSGGDSAGGGGGSVGVGATWPRSPPAGRW